MKPFLTGVLVFMIAACASIFSAAQDSCNVYTYGGSNNDYARQIISTSDSGYIVVGTTSSFGVALTDIYIIKIDSNGVKQWSHFYGSDHIDWGYSIRETFDHGYIITGYTNQNQSAGYDIYLLKLNGIGEVQWAKTIGGPDWDFGYGIELTPDSGFIICGKSYSFSNGGSDAFLVKTNAAGDVVWQKNYGDQGDESVNAIIRDRDNNYGLVGVTTSFGNGFEDEWLLKINGNGDTLWTKTFGGFLTDIGYAIDTTGDGGFVTNATSNSFTTDSTSDMMLIKTSTDGTAMWTQMHGAPSNDEEGYVVDVFPNGNIFDGGVTWAYGLGQDAFYALRSDQDGNYITGAAFGGSDHEEGYSIAVGKDNKVVLAGITDSDGCGLWDIYLIRIDTFAFQSEHPPIIHVTCDTTIGIEERDLSQSAIAVYPNPSSDRVFIDFNSKKIKDEYVVSLTDVTGKEIKKITVHAFLVSLDVTDLNDGFYFVNIYQNEHLLGTQKLIVY